MSKTNISCLITSSYVNDYFHFKTAKSDILLVVSGVVCFPGYSFLSFKISMINIKYLATYILPHILPPLKNVSVMLEFICGICEQYLL